MRKLSRAQNVIANLKLGMLVTLMVVDARRPCLGSDKHDRSVGRSTDPPDGPLEASQEDRIPPLHRPHAGQVRIPGTDNQDPAVPEEIGRAEDAEEEAEGYSADELYDDACRVVLESRRGSVSLLQRKLEIGYTRAARLVDMMAAEGIVGNYKGSKAREVIMTLEEWEESRGIPPGERASAQLVGQDDETSFADDIADDDEE